MDECMTRVYLADAKLGERSASTMEKIRAIYDRHIRAQVHNQW